MRNSENNSVVMALLGDKCCKCGFNNPLALVMDHVKGDGSIERGRFSRDAITNYIVMAVKYNVKEALNIIFERYQILCANCNMIKAYENGENGNVMQQYANINCLNEVKRLRHLVLTAHEGRCTNA